MFSFEYHKTFPDSFFRAFLLKGASVDSIQWSNWHKIWDLWAHKLVWVEKKNNIPTMIVFLDSATLATVYINRNNLVVHCYLDNQYKIYKAARWPRSYGERVRGSRAEIIFKKTVPKNSTKITGKHLCQSLIFNKIAGFPLETFIYPLTFSGSI